MKTFLSIDKFGTIFLFVAFFQLVSCKKYLDARPDIRLEVPNTAEDLQALLDNTAVMNQVGPQFPETASDNYYVQFADFQSASTTDRAIYTWDEKTISSVDYDYKNAYSVISYANIVLDNLSKIEAGTSAATVGQIKGQALFFRSLSFFNLASEFSIPYSQDNASSPYGICLRLTSDINVPSVRSTVQETYDRIIGDLKIASTLLATPNSYPTRPNKIACFGLLARVYLAMRDYTNAGVYADSALKIYDKLIDYNTVDPTQPFPFPQFNDEVIFHTISYYRGISTYGGALVDTTLFAMYDNSDLRKSLYFNSGVYIGTYSGGDYGYFQGIATDELYLVRAECNARANNISAALNDLNKLLLSRFTTGSFSPLSTTNQPELLKIVLDERRKELVYRGVRWADLRRLNQEAPFQTTIVRNLDGQIISLSPNDKRYTFLIPQDVIINSSIKQNPE